MAGLDPAISCRRRAASGDARLKAGHDESGISPFGIRRGHISREAMPGLRAPLTSKKSPCPGLARASASSRGTAPLVASRRGWPDQVRPRGIFGCGHHTRCNLIRLTGQPCACAGMTIHLGGYRSRSGFAGRTRCCCWCSRRGRGWRRRYRAAPARPVRRCWRSGSSE
jgi:hypothetical protein